jgi:hypothetical protein
LYRERERVRERGRKIPKKERKNVAQGRVKIEMLAKISNLTFCVKSVKCVKEGQNTILKVQL